MQLTKQELIMKDESDCICEKPNGKHRNNCNAFRLSEFFKKCGACTKIKVTDVDGKETIYESNKTRI